MSKKLYVGNIPFKATEDELRQVFSSYNVSAVSMVMDRETGRPRGFAFVTVEDGDRAITEVNGTEMGGRRLMVNEARERENRGPRPQGEGSFEYGRHPRN